MGKARDIKMLKIKKNLQLTSVTDLSPDYMYYNIDKRSELSIYMQKENIIAIDILYLETKHHF